MESVLEMILKIGIKYKSIDHYIKKGWLNPNDYDSFKKQFIKIHKDWSISKEDWIFDFYGGNGSMVGCPTKTTCITVYQVIHEKGKTKRENITRFKWNDVIPHVFRNYNNINTVEQLKLF